MSGVIYTYAIHPDHNAGYDPRKEREKQIRGEPYHVPPSAVVEETRWQVFVVKANAAMPKEMFALSFPDKSIYVDDREAKLKVTGSAEKLIDDIIGPETSQPGVNPRSAYIRWLIVASVSFLLVLAGTILYFRHRRTAGS